MQKKSNKKKIFGIMSKLGNFINKAQPVLGDVPPEKDSEQEENIPKKEQQTKKEEKNFNLQIEDDEKAEYDLNVDDDDEEEEEEEDDDNEEKKEKQKEKTNNEESTSTTTDNDSNNDKKEEKEIKEIKEEKKEEIKSEKKEEIKVEEKKEEDSKNIIDEKKEKVEEKIEKKNEQNIEKEKTEVKKEEIKKEEKIEKKEEKKIEDKKEDKIEEKKEEKKEIKTEKKEEKKNKTKKGEKKEEKKEIDDSHKKVENNEKLKKDAKKVNKPISKTGNHKKESEKKGVIVKIESETKNKPSKTPVQEKPKLKFQKKPKITDENKICHFFLKKGTDIDVKGYDFFMVKKIKKQKSMLSKLNNFGINLNLNIKLGGINKVGDKLNSFFKKKPKEIKYTDYYLIVNERFIYFCKDAEVFIDEPDKRRIGSIIPFHNLTKIEVVKEGELYKIIFEIQFRTLNKTKEFYADNDIYGELLEVFHEFKKEYNLVYNIEIKEKK